MRDFLQHHAFLVNSDTSNVLLETLEKEKVRTGGNPDFHLFDFETLGIGEARTISDRAAKKPFGEESIIVVRFETATTEAQNALLKTLEDPRPHTRFFLVTPHATSLLSTLRSRCELIEIKHEEAPVSEISPELFLQTSCGKRLDLLEEIIKEGESEKARVLIDGVEKYLYESRGELDGERLLAFREIARARKYLGARGSSLKLILSHFALALPVINREML